MTRDLETLRRLFVEYVEECRDYSPIYEHLSAAVAQDTDLLRIADNAPLTQPPPNLIFGAVHYLLLGGVDHPLQRYFADLADGPPLPAQEAAPAFREFCLQHEPSIAKLMASRLVQTNEVNRSACLLPAFTEVYRRGGRQPLALIDVGASAGLNLLFDGFHVDYGRQTWGDATSRVRLRCELAGDTPLPIAPGEPVAGFRAGVDLNPVDVTDADELLWLRALVWPEHHERAERLLAAADLARRHPPRLLRGSAVDLLPGLIAEVPAGETLCLYYSFVLHQFPPDDRRRFWRLTEDAGQERDVYVVSMQGAARETYVELSWWCGQDKGRQRLAECLAHGQWLRWFLP